MIKILLLALICFTLTGCPRGTHAPEALRPINRIFSHMPEGGAPEYNKGWKEGCESGLSGMSNSFYASFYTHKIDVTMVNNEVYYKAWKDSYDYCKQYSYGYLKESNMRRPLANEWGKGWMTRGRAGILDIFDAGPGLFRW